MSRLALVGPAGQPLPEALELLPHTTDRYTEVADCIDHLDVTDVVLVDCRAEPARAKEICLQVSSQTSNAPVVLLASAATLSVVTRDWGADDFLTDTATPLEADARLRFVTSGQESRELVAGPFTVDEEAYTATVAGQPLDLTYTEFELLKFLVAHPGRVLTRDVLLSEVWGYDYYGGTRTVDVHIRRLRAKIGPEYDGHIQTVRSVGYRFQAQR